MHLDLNTIWFVLVGVLFTGYAVLDGFDLGIGALHLFAKKDEERRVLLNAIGPVWDGNEVWLVTGGGALFAAFPNVYATAFSGFYLALYLLLAALIFRAVAIEFRSKRPEKWWRQTWDVSFSAGSILSALLIGTTLGNLAWGVPIDANGEFAGTFLGLLTPYPLLIGVTSDAAVRGLKGAGRPVNSETDRAAVLAALASVDGVCIFTETTATNFLAAAQPDIYVKGGDYTLDTLNQDERRAVESAGGKIVLVPFVPGKTTTALLEQISRL